MLRRGTTKGKGKGKGAREAARSRSVGGEPSGDEGGLQLRRAAMDAEEAARICFVDGRVPEDAVAIGSKTAKGRPVSKLSNKLIRAVVSSEAGKATAAAAVSAAEVAGGVDEGEKDVAPAPAAEEDTAVMKMPQEYVDWILSQKRHVLEEDPDEYYNRMINDPDRDEVYTQQFLEEERQLMRDMATLYQRSGDRLEKFQRWVRHQLETRGFVEINDLYFTLRTSYREGYKKLYDAMMQVPGFIYNADDVVKQVESQLAEGVAIESN